MHNNVLRLDKTVVNRAVLRLPQGISPHEKRRWRSEAERTLSYVTLTIGGLPPHAILVVRHLEDPLPGGLWQGTAWKAGNRWGHQVSATLEDYWRTAARPFYQVVSPNAAAVWFTDAAEWLACLSLDIYRGIAGQRWWWQTWVRRLNAQSSALAALWRAEVRWLPAALAALHDWNWQVTRDVVATLSPDESKTVRASLAHAYRLPTGYVQSGLNLRKWTRYIPDGKQALPEEMEAAQLLALALALHFMPDAILTLMPGDSSRALRARDDRRLHTDQRLIADQRSPPRIDAHLPATGLDPGQLTLADGHRVANDELNEAQVTGDRTEADIDGISPPLTASEFEQGYAEQPITTLMENWRTTFSDVSYQDSPNQGATEGFRTHLGGVWYLVNVLIALDLLATNDSSLNPWHKLRVLACELLSPELPSDILWDVLEDLGSWVEANSQSFDVEAKCWLALHLPIIETWLSEMLDDAKTIASHLMQPATLYVTRTHIDVVFSLDAIDLSIRKAGLDRNPGWVPELSRIITFHFL